MKNIPEDVLTVLSSADIEGSSLRLTGQLERKLYTRTDKVLKAAGGKWNRGAMAHVFDGSASDAIEPLLLTGQYSDVKQDFGQFDTPIALAEEVVERAGVQPGHTVLEPSAGVGRIARAAQIAGGDVTAVELDDSRYRSLCLTEEGVICHLGDFLTYEGLGIFDRVVMNPPFSKGADVEHFMRAWSHLKPGGRIVAIMSAGALFRREAKYCELRHLVDSAAGEIARLPDGSFKESGTGVSSVLVVIDKPNI